MKTRVSDIERSFIQYAITYYEIRNVYRMLTGVESKNENCERAINTYKKVL
ncbi:MAG: hypothetical protein ACUVWP_08860 [bacterium]